MSLSIEGIAASAEQAAKRIAELVHQTPLEYSPFFSEKFSADVHLKLENEQRTGSFKLRGASNRLMTLSPEQRAKGCVAASSGNHGAAVAYAMRALDTGGVIFVPEQTSRAKVEAIRSYGGEVRFFGNDGLDTEQHAREFAESNGMFYLSPYNDAEVIAGQGSCGIEIANQMHDADVVFIAVGGGGLVSGVGSVLKMKNPDIRLIGCQPEASPVMARSVEAGRILDMPSDPTLSDGTAGGIEAGSVTFDLCRQLVDEFVLVSEAEIAQGMREFSAERQSEIEGAAGVAIAALGHYPDSIAGKKVVVIVCGGNVSQETLDASYGL
jgi:threonine dehydratase